MSVPGSLRRWLTAGVCASALFWTPGPAKADPISAAIVSALAITGTAATVATFVITTALQLAGAYALSKLAGPKQKAQDRQASVTTINVGEVPREVVFGRACTGGSLMSACNYGGEYGTDWECLEMALADHQLDGLEGYYIDSTYYPFLGNGLQAGFSNCLDIEFVNANDDVAPPARFAAAGFGDLDRARGVAKVWFAYKADSKVWPQGRPSVKFVVRGKRCYDPRLDDTVPGGSGPQRWNAPFTWTWTENAKICHYNFQRGIYALDQVDQPQHLLVGRGLTAIEAPPERVFAAANVCDELVALKAGGTERRYRVGGVIRADETFDAVEEMFAAAMAGVIVQREGGVEIEPGQAKSTVAEITDLDLVVGEKVSFDRFLPDTQRMNSVVGRYIEPAQAWSDHAAPIRRSILDIQDDGGPREESLSLSLVTSGTQAQRCAEIHRRLGRMERRSTIVLGPRFSGLEEGDWIGWTSDRRHGGGRVVYRVEAWSRAPSWRRTLALREIASSAFTWVAANDELVPGTPPPAEAARPGPLALGGVLVYAVNLTGADGSREPAIKATWFTPVDPAVLGVRLEVRVAGEADVAATSVSTREGIDSGVLVTTNGVAASATLEARLVPLADQSREVIPSDWDAVITGPSTASGATSVPWSGVADDDGQRPEDGADVTANHTAADTAAVAGRSALQVINDFDLDVLNLAEELLRAGIWRGEADTLLYIGGVPIRTVTQQLGVTVGGHTAFITQLQEVDGNGNAKLLFAVNSDGNVAGMELVAGGGLTEINFLANILGVTDPNGVGPPTKVLEYSGGKWRFKDTLYVQRLIADIIETQHLKINSVVTDRIVDHSLSDNMISGASSTVYGTGFDVILFSQTFTLDYPARVRAEGDVAFLDGGGNGPSYHQSRLRLTINGDQVNRNDAGGVVATSVLAITGSLEVPAGSCTVELIGMTKPDDYYTFRNLFTEWFYK